MNKKRLTYIAELDGLRGIAVLLVCLAHFYQIDEQALYESNKYLGIVTFKLSQIGLRGVDLFFLLSGYLITRILLFTKESNNYFITFYSRRFLRIFPLYYFVLFLAFFVLPNFIEITNEAQNIINHQWKLWTYTSNLFFISPVKWDTGTFPDFGHFWSLSVEEHFYLFWPFLVYFGSKKTKGFMWGILLFSVFCWILGLSVDFFNWTTLKFSGVLSIGGLIAYYESYDRKRIVDYFEKTKKYTIYIFVFFVLSAFLPRSWGHYGDFFIFLISSLFFSVTIMSAIFSKKRIKIFSNKVLIFIGSISYGIYVYHGLLRPYFKCYIYDYLISRMPNGICVSIIYTIVSTSLSIMIAYLSWHFFEKHFLKLKKYFKYAK